MTYVTVATHPDFKLCDLIRQDTQSQNPGALAMSRADCGLLNMKGSKATAD